MKQAHDAGFAVRFRYVCVDSAGTSIIRVTQRAYEGGHSGSEDTVREIRSKSLGNFPRVLDELGRSVDFLNVYDNSALDSRPRRIATFQAREIVFLDPQIPAWLTESLEQTAYSTQSLLACLHRKQPLPDPPSPD
jgi:predicted ABC-type ATPase